MRAPHYLSHAIMAIIVFDGLQMGLAPKSGSCLQHNLLVEMIASILLAPYMYSVFEMDGIGACRAEL